MFMLTLRFTNFKNLSSCICLDFKLERTKYNWCSNRFQHTVLIHPFMIFLTIFTVTPPLLQTHSTKLSSVLVTVGYGPWEVVYLLFSITLFAFQVQLTWKIVETGSNYPRREFVREVLDKPVLQLVPHLGYVSLFPFILRLIPPVSSLALFQQYNISSCFNSWFALYLDSAFLASYWQ